MLVCIYVMTDIVFITFCDVQRCVFTLKNLLFLLLLFVAVALLVIVVF